MHVTYSCTQQHQTNSQCHNQSPTTKVTDAERGAGWTVTPDNGRQGRTMAQIRTRGAQTP